MNKTMQNFFSKIVITDKHENFSMYEYTISRVDYLLGEEKKSIFANSPFYEMKKRNPHVRGNVGERLVKLLCEDNGLLVSRSKTADLWIDNIDVEIKTVMQNESGGFIINQIRPQNYRYVVIIAFMPFSVYLFTIPKDKLLVLCNGQHGGKNATETFMYNAPNIDKLIEQLGIYEGLDNFINSFID